MITYLDPTKTVCSICTYVIQPDFTMWFKYKFQSWIQLKMVCKICLQVIQLDSMFKTKPCTRAVSTDCSFMDPVQKQMINMDIKKVYTPCYMCTHKLQPILKQRWVCHRWDNGSSSFQTPLWQAITLCSISTGVFFVFPSTIYHRKHYSQCNISINNPFCVTSIAGRHIGIALAIVVCVGVGGGGGGDVRFSD